MTQGQADRSYLQIAHVWALNSKATKLKVGAIIVKDGMIISDGFNGTPKGFDNTCEIEYIDENHNRYLKTKPEVLHAEANAITKVAKSTQSSEGATLYCTDSPCINCAKLILQAGIVRVVYDRLYSDDAGIKLLQQAGVQVDRIKLD